MKIALVFTLLLVAVYGGPLHQNEFNNIIDTVNTSGAKWKAGHNFGENTTVASLKILMGTKIDKRLKLKKAEKPEIPDAYIPDNFDARERWPECKSIAHISDQGNCGSCWAVASADTFTDRLCIVTKGKFTMRLSTEELLSCCRECGKGCQGGYTDVAWDYFSGNGLVTGGDYNSNEGCQPYEIPACSHHVKSPLPPCKDPSEDTPKCHRKCTNPAYPKSFSSDHHMTAQSSVYDNLFEVQIDILINGPVQADFIVYEDFLTYKSGVYHHVTGAKLGGHAVRIIGWGVEDGTPYWLVANSWNQSWGDNGLFKILRGKNECGIEDGINSAVPII